MIQCRATFYLSSKQISTDSAIKNPLCEPPEEPVNGYLLSEYGPTKKLVSVNYKCHLPFTLIGPQKRICLPDATWSGAVPTCVKGTFLNRLLLGLFLFFFKGHIVHSIGEFALILFQAHIGHTSRVQCSPPAKLLNGYHEPTLDTAAGVETIEFFCNKPYILSGNHQSSCLSNGTWSSRPPKCVRGGYWICFGPYCCTHKTFFYCISVLFRSYIGIQAQLFRLQEIKQCAKRGFCAVIIACLLSFCSVSTTQSVGTCATNYCEATSDIKVDTKTLYALTSLQRSHSQMFFHREHPDQRFSTRHHMYDLLSAGFVPLTLDKKSKQVDSAFAELPRGFHPVYTSIDYKCASPLYKNTGSARRTCLKTGRWSGRHVSCSPGESSVESITLFGNSLVPGYSVSLPVQSSEKLLSCNST